MASRTSSITGSTQLLLRGERRNLTPQNAWEEGTGIRTALRLHPQATRAWFLAELGQLIKFVDATKTIQDDAEMKETARALMEEFPCFKLEEFALVFEGIKRNKFGPMYGRLKLVELMECCPSGKRHEPRESWNVSIVRNVTTIKDTPGPWSRERLSC